MTPTCLVTGGAGKLGTALCTALAETHQIAAVYHRKLPTFASQLRHAIPFEGGGGRSASANEPFCVQGDLTRAEDIRRVVEVVLARFGRVDVLINAAADTRFHGKLLELSFGSIEVQNQLFTNCIAPMQLVSALFQESWKHERAANQEFNRCVINVSSVSGLYVYPSVGQAFYSASKAALNFLTRHLAGELADYRVRANAICPSRFPECVSTERVVSQVMHLIASQVTGEVVEVSSRSDSPSVAGRTDAL